MRRARSGAAVDEALAAAGLSGDADANPYDLGYSRRKLLALASILAMRTPVVVLDEPTTGQDARGVARVEEIVAGLAELGRTVVAISHDMAFVAESFERIVVMRDGRVDPRRHADRGLRRVVVDRARVDVPRAATRRHGSAPGWAFGTTPTEASLVAALTARASRANGAAT